MLHNLLILYDVNQMLVLIQNVREVYRLLFNSRLCFYFCFLWIKYEFINILFHTMWFKFITILLLCWQDFYCNSELPNKNWKYFFFFKSTLKLPTFLIEYSFFRKWLFLMTTNFIIFHVFFILVYVNLIISKPSLIKLTVHGFSVMFTMFLS